ncbi:MAG TPA: hypothetical protein VEU07_10135, partial [Candidatus Acidoferrum sp.]|nr:hypothetical protein [Candidatus Acidoferrum sp.]
SRNILLYGIDVDACTGAQTPRAWGSIGVDQGPPTGAVLGRWRFRPPCTAVGTPTDKACLMTPAGTFLPPTREMRATIETVLGSGITAPTVVTGTGLTVNQYQAPIFDFLFPENTMIGSPIVPLNLDTMQFLTQGSGPLDPTQPASATNPLVGQLNPWPGLAVPAAANCAVAGVPTANAGPAQIVGSGALVTLTGTGLDGGAPPLTFAWTQTAGTPVVLSQNATTGIATFTAPLVAPGAAANLTFSLVVTNAAGVASAPSFVTVTVNPVATDTVTISLVEYRRSNQRLTVNAGSTASTAVPPANLTMQAFDANGVAQGPPQLMTLSGGLYVVVISGVPQPTSVKVTSDHGGSATSGITRLR